MARLDTQDIHRFLLSHVRDHPNGLVALAADRFGVSRQAIVRHIDPLIADGVLRRTGRGRGTRYELVEQIRRQVDITVGPETEDHTAWLQELQPCLSGAAENIRGICSYGATEMINNVIDHSGSKTASVELVLTAIDVQINVSDWGRGIFRKIKEDLGLDDESQVLLELSKGKLTTDPQHHTGEGIFFTSRMFDDFSIVSGSLVFIHHVPDDDWLMEVKEHHISGTYVSMGLPLASKRTPKEVFDQYSNTQDDYYGFERTRVPLKLAQYGEEKLVSRSQARRVLTRFDRFKEVFLDFEGVDSVGPAFADEIFRVFQSEHPDIHIEWIRANLAVTQMIRRALAVKADKQTTLFEANDDADSAGDASRQ